MCGLQGFLFGLAALVAAWYGGIALCMWAESKRPPKEEG